MNMKDFPQKRARAISTTMAAIGTQLAAKNVTICASFHGSSNWLAGLLPCKHAQLGKTPRRLHRTMETVPLPGQANATLRFDARQAGISSGGRPRISIIMPAHNAEKSLSHSLPLLFRNTASCAELLLLLDQCTDGSLDTVLQHTAIWLPRAVGITRVRVVEQSTPVWESAAETLLMAASDPTLAYICIQPDNFVTAHGWDAQLARPLLVEAWQVWAVSGFIGHGMGDGDAIWQRWYGYRRPAPNASDTPGCSHYVGGWTMVAKSAHWFRNVSPNVSSGLDVFHERETVARGPLMLHAAKAQALRFYDFENFWLDMADHDMSCRATERGWRAGFVFGVGLSHCTASWCRTKGHENNAPGDARGTAEARALSNLMLSRLYERQKAVRQGGNGLEAREGCLRNRTLIEHYASTPRYCVDRQMPFPAPRHERCLREGSEAL